MKTLCNYLILVIITSALAITACGGGGGKADSRVNDYNVNLKTLSVSEGTLVFDPDKTAYDIEVHDTVNTITVFAAASDSSCRVTVNGADITPGTGADILLFDSINYVSVMVTAPDNVTSKNYIISISRVNKSSNANLAHLDISSGTLSPAFDKDTTAYNVDVAGGVDEVTVEAIAAGTGAVITVNGATLDSDNESQPIAILSGTNLITIKVTAENGATKNYVIAVNGEESPANANLANLVLSAGELYGGFSPDKTAYTAYVLYLVQSITVRPVAAWSRAEIRIKYGYVEETVESGQSSQSIPLAEGNNTITIEVEAASGAVKTYVVAVYRIPANNNPDLANLTVSAGSLTPAFSVNTTGYNVTVPFVTGNITVTPTTAVVTSTVTVNNVTVQSGTASQVINLNVGTNTITVRVLAESNISRVYTIVVNRTAANTNTSLSNLTISSGTLSPSFTPNTTGYNVSVPYATTGLRITPTAAGYNATISVNGAAVASGTATGTIALPVGNSIIIIVVMAEDKSIKTYTLSVTRADANTNNNLAGLTLSAGTLSPGFSENTTSYTAEIAYAVTSIRVTSTVAGYNATVRVNGSMVSSGTASAAISMSVGGNTITIVVTAENGTTKIYTLSVNRIAASTNSDLANLSISAGTLSPGFNPDVTSYSVEVAYATGTCTVTPAVAGFNATVRVNGVTVSSGTASATFNLSVGSNTISVVVTAENGSTKAYTVTVNRIAASTNSDLASLSLSAGTLSPGFNADVISYSVEVAYATGTCTVTPAVAGLNASVRVNGLTVPSGTASATFNLSVGSNTIGVVVTAENGSTKTYTVTVNRIAASTNSDLASLTVSAGELSPAFQQDVTSYSVSVSKETTAITLTPVAAGLNASVKVNSVTVVSGTPSAWISLNEGNNSLTVAVTAESGDVKLYYITAYRIPYDSNADLINLTLSSGILSPVFISSTTHYAAEVSNETASVTVTAVTSLTTSRVMVNGTEVASGSASDLIDLAVGLNSLSIVVTAENGTKKTYVISVSRLNPPSKSVIISTSRHTMIINDDYSLWATGWNYYGQLGDGTTENKLTPVQIMTDVRDVSAGSDYTMVLKNDGTLWTTGNNYYGQLGDGTTTDKSSFVQIMTDVQDVSASGYCTMIIKNNGTLWAVGGNQSGQLGLGYSSSYISKPVQTMTNVKSVASSGTFTMIIKNDNTLWATGSNNHGQLGDGTTADKSSFVLIMADVKNVSVSGHTMILKNDGTLWASGWNWVGQLGDGTTTDRSTPVQVMTNVKDVSIGNNHTMILKQDDTLWASGYNEYGQLGDGTTINKSTPVQVMADVAMLFEGHGGDSTIIKKNDGYCWAAGRNSRGQFGNGTTRDSLYFIRLPW